MSLPLGSGPLKGYAVATLPGGEQTIRAALLTWTKASGAGDPAQEHRVLNHATGAGTLAELAASALRARAAELAADFAPAPAEKPPAKPEPVACLWTPAEKAAAVRDAEREMGPAEMVAHEQGPGGEMREVFSWGDAVLAFAYHHDADVWEDISAKVTEERGARRAPTPEEVVDLSADLLEVEPLAAGDRAALATMPPPQEESGHGARDSAGEGGTKPEPPPPPVEVSTAEEPDPLELEADSYWGSFVVMREPLAEPERCAGCGEPLMPGAWLPEALTVRITQANPPEYSHRGCIESMMADARKAAPGPVDVTPPPPLHPKPTEWSGELKIAGRKLKAPCALCGVGIQKGAGYHEGKPRGARGHGSCVAVVLGPAAEDAAEREAIVAANAGPA